MPPKQNPIAAIRPSTPGQPASAARPARAPCQQRRVVAERGQRCDDAGPVARDAVAKHVAREDDVAQGGVAPGLLPGMAVKPAAAVHEQNARAVARRRLILVEHACQPDHTVVIRHVAQGDSADGSICDHAADFSN